MAGMPPATGFVCVYNISNSTSKGYVCCWLVSDLCVLLQRQATPEVACVLTRCCLAVLPSTCWCGRPPVPCHCHQAGLC